MQQFMLPWCRVKCYPLEGDSMAHTKKERKKAISDIPDIPGGPFWRRLGPYGPAIPLIPRLAKEIAKVMIDHEEMVGLGHGAQFDESYDWDAATRRRQQEERWAAMDFERSSIKTGDVGIKVTRKVSAYSKLFGKELKKLIKKHPRTKVTNLMKRAHTATKKKMPKKKGKATKGRRRIAASGQFRRDKILPRRK